MFFFQSLKTMASIPCIIFIFNWKILKFRKFYSYVLLRNIIHNDYKKLWKRIQFFISFFVKNFFFNWKFSILIFSKDLWNWFHYDLDNAMRFFSQTVSQRLSFKLQESLLENVEKLSIALLCLKLFINLRSILVNRYKNLIINLNLNFAIIKMII